MTLPNSSVFNFYEGTDPQHYTDLTGVNLNAAAKALLANDVALKTAVNSLEDNFTGNDAKNSLALEGHTIAEVLASARYEAFRMPQHSAQDRNGCPYAVGVQSQVTPFSGWYAGPISTVTQGIASYVNGYDTSAQQGDLLNALLDYAGISRNHFFSGSGAITIAQLDWSETGGRSGHALPYRYNQCPSGGDGKMTVACFVKINPDVPLTGAKPYGWYLTGIDWNNPDWQLVGGHYSGGSDYNHTHPYIGGNGAGSLFVALPAVVDGYVDLSNPRNWTLFIN